MFEKRRYTIILGLVGILGGMLYSELIGCETGCVLKSSPWIMALYGSFFGGVLGSWIDEYRLKRNRTNNSD